MRVLVTGGSGFVGGALLRRLDRDVGLELRAALRRPCADLPQRVESVVVGDLGPDTDWFKAVDGVDVVVHCAARVHVMNDAAASPSSEYQRCNVDGTVRLAQAAHRAGVKRFIFLSSVKVHGESTHGQPWTESDVPAPEDDYGRSKLAAESELRALADEAGMELVIIRPPLVHGPGVKANFRSLVRWVSRGLPLPLASIDNRRSLIGLDNLVDFIHVCISHPAAANEVFLVSDGEDVSTPQLALRLGRVLGRSPRMIAIPASWLKLAARVLGRETMIERVCGDLEVDISKARLVLGWTPPLTLDEGLARVAANADFHHG